MINQKNLYAPFVMTINSFFHCDYYNELRNILYSSVEHQNVSLLSNETDKMKILINAYPRQTAKYSCFSFFSI